MNYRVSRWDPFTHPRYTADLDVDVSFDHTYTQLAPLRSNLLNRHFRAELFDWLIVYIQISS